MQQTLIILKPDAVERGLVGEILKRFENKGLKIAAIKMLRITPELAQKHYADHTEKDFYPDLERYIMQSPVIAAVLEGSGQTVTVVRKMVGPTDGNEAPAGTIRGDYSLSSRLNLVHASDSPESAEREIKIFFAE